MKDLYLRIYLEIIERYTGSSKFDFFNKLEPVTIVEIRTRLDRINSPYANECELVIKNGRYINDNFRCGGGQLINYLDKMQYMELSND